MKVLINAYACSPYQGSEPGMGWNFVKCLSTKHELHIITESKYKNEIEDYLAKHPEEKALYRFYYVKRSRHNLLRRIWPPSYYWFYEAWQKKVLKLAQELDQKENFDLVHQLNMVGYREPGFLWRLNKPFIWGPISGFNITPWNLLHTMGLYGLIFYSFRNIINIWQMHSLKRVHCAIDKASAVICATQDDSDSVKRIFDKENVIIPEVGYTKLDGVESKDFNRKCGDVLKICWSGLHIPRKSLNFLLESLKDVQGVELHILGDGPKRNVWEKLAKNLGIENVKWYGKVKREDALTIMQSCDVFAQTSLSDASSTVLLEALSLGLPVIALDHLGFANIITSNCGIKIAVKNSAQIVSDFKKAILKLRDDCQLLERLSKGAIERAQENSWEHKANVICDLYDSAVKELQK